MPAPDTTSALPAVRPGPRATRAFSGFRPDIEGLRALAILLVVADHAWGWPAGGFVGVDVFFVISGYLITRGLLHEQERDGRVSLSRFYVRRAARLLPAAALVIVATAAACFAVYFPVTAVPYLFQAVSSLFWVQNWSLIREGADYLNPSGAVSPFQHFWSLSVEEQFYAVWPWLLVAAWVLAGRRGRGRRIGGGRAEGRIGARRGSVLALVAAVTVASLALSTVLTGFGSATAYFLPLTRAWEFGVGALVACAGRGFSGRGTGALSARWAGLGMIVAAALLYSPETAFPGVAAVLPVAGAALVVLAAERARHGEVGIVVRPFGRALTATPVRWLGRVSYSLYLWHAPVLLLLAVAFGRDAWVPWCAAALALVLAALTYRLVEDPVRHLRLWEGIQARLGRPRPSRARFWGRVGGFASTALLIVALSVVQWRGPVPAPAGAAALTPPEPVASAVQLHDRLRAALAADGWSGYARQLSGGALTGAPQLACMRDPVDGAGDGAAAAAACADGAGSGRLAVVIGDSIAMSWAPAVEQALGADWRVSSLGLQSCPAASVRVREARGRAAYPAACERARSSDLDAVVALKPDLVVLASAEGGILRLDSGATGDASATEWQAGLERTLERLRALGRPVVVIGNPPETRAPQDCANRFSTPAACARPPSSAYTTKDGAERRAVVAAAGAGLDVRFVDPLPWFCVEGVCPVGDGSVIARIDHGHLSEDYARMLGGLLRPELLPAQRQDGGGS